MTVEIWKRRWGRLEGKGEGWERRAERLGGGGGGGGGGGVVVWDRVCPKLESGRDMYSHTRYKIKTKIPSSPRPEFVFSPFHSSSIFSAINYGIK